MKEDDEGATVAMITCPEETLVEAAGHVMQRSRLEKGERAEKLAVEGDERPMFFADVDNLNLVQERVEYLPACHLQRRSEASPRTVSMKFTSMRYWTMLVREGAMAL